jgi:voltage-gated potassium channel
VRGIPIQKLFIAISLFAGSIVIGMTGFRLIERFSMVDSFYMAVITLGSVGFTEVHELSKAGRMFTSLYIILNLGIYAYVIAVVGQ